MKKERIGTTMNLQGLFGDILSCVDILFQLFDQEEIKEFLITAMGVPTSLSEDFLIQKTSKEIQKKDFENDSSGKETVKKEAGIGDHSAIQRLSSKFLRKFIQAYNNKMIPKNQTLFDVDKYLRSFLDRF